MSSSFYDFVFRGILTNNLVEKLNCSKGSSLQDDYSEGLISKLPYEDFKNEYINDATKMAGVYILIFAFEKSVRSFIEKLLLEKIGENWWESVSSKIQSKSKSRAESEEKVLWHSPRGEAPINYCDFGDLVSIIGQNWSHFEPHLNDLEWAKHILNTIERSRNVIMHSGMLGTRDIERISSHIKDWISQVGA